MAERKRVGVVFSYNENWIAGTYYILNIINALNTVEDSRKPVIVLLTDDPNNRKIVYEQTQYPFLDTIPFPKKRNLFQYKLVAMGISLK